MKKNPHRYDELAFEHLKPIRSYKKKKRKSSKKLKSHEKLIFTILGIIGLVAIISMILFVTRPAGPIYGEAPGFFRFQQDIGAVEKSTVLFTTDSDRFKSEYKVEVSPKREADKWIIKSINTGSNLKCNERCWCWSNEYNRDSSEGWIRERLPDAWPETMEQCRQNCMNILGIALGKYKGELSPNLYWKYYSCVWGDKPYKEIEKLTVEESMTEKPEQNAIIKPEKIRYVKEIELLSGEQKLIKENTCGNGIIEEGEYCEQTSRGSVIFAEEVYIGEGSHNIPSEKNIAITKAFWEVFVPALGGMDATMASDWELRFTYNGKKVYSEDIHDDICEYLTGGTDCNEGHDVRYDLGKCYNCKIFAPKIACKDIDYFGDSGESHWYFPRFDLSSGNVNEEYEYMKSVRYYEDDDDFNPCVKEGIKVIE